MMSIPSSSAFLGGLDTFKREVSASQVAKESYSHDTLGLIQNFQQLRDSGGFSGAEQSTAYAKLNFIIGRISDLGIDVSFHRDIIKGASTWGYGGGAHTSATTGRVVASSSSRRTEDAFDTLRFRKFPPEFLNELSLYIDSAYDARAEKIPTEGQLYDWLMDLLILKKSGGFNKEKMYGLAEKVNTMLEMSNTVPAKATHSDSVVAAFQEAVENLSARVDSVVSSLEEGNSNIKESDISVLFLECNDILHSDGLTKDQTDTLINLYHKINNLFGLVVEDSE